MCLLPCLVVMLQAGLTLKAVNLPSQDLAFTNRVYTSTADYAQLGGQPQTICYIETKGCYFTIEGHPQMEQGSIALNKVQREWAKVGLNAEVFAKRYSVPKGFDLGAVTFEVDFLLKPQPSAPRVEIQGDQLEEVFRKAFVNQICVVGQKLAFDFEGKLLHFIVTGTQPFDLGTGEAQAKTDKGILTSQTEIDFRQGSSGKLHVLSNKVQQRSIFRPDFNFEELGIGGLNKEFSNIFRRAFASRVFPPHVVRDLGINHVRGMLLYGPPGTGKTLMARQIAKFLKAAEPKIVNGPEILNKYVGASEENIRKLFEDAEKEYKLEGDNSQLHIVIFDEIDAICKSRGSSKDSTGVSDSIVNQLLSKIDGVDALNNILLIGMTNRIDMLDEALLRPGRLEVHCEINLPDESGRIEILNIHTGKMRAKGYLGPDVSIEALAAGTKNFSGAEIEGLVRSATSFALNTKVNVSDINKPKDISEIKVTNSDFEHALGEVKPAFGQHEDDFEHCARKGIIPYSQDFEKLQSTCKSLVEQVQNSDNTPLLSVLLAGRPGTGKTALAATIARSSDYDFVRMVAAENYVGHSESGKASAITKIFEDAYKSSLSLIVLDGIERLMDYVRIGPRFSNIVLQALFNLVKKAPPKAGRRLLIIGTTSDPAFLEEAELLRAFNVVLNVPVLSDAAHFKAVLQRNKAFEAAEVEKICAALVGQRIGIQQMLLAVDMAVQRQSTVQSETFMECLRHIGVLE